MDVADKTDCRQKGGGMQSRNSGGDLASVSCHRRQSTRVGKNRDLKKNQFFLFKSDFYCTSTY